MQDECCMFPFICLYYLYVTFFLLIGIIHLANLCYLVQSYGPQMGSNVQLMAGGTVILRFSNCYRPKIWLEHSVTKC
jgi:hypothetical protein